MNNHFSPAANRGESGSVFFVVALLLVVIFGFSAFTIDVGRTLDEQRRLQIAADAGALAGSRVLGSTTSIATIRNESCAVAKANGLTDSEISAVQCGVWSGGNFTMSCSAGCTGTATCTACNGSTVNAVRVLTNKNVDMSFGRVLGVNSMTPNRESVSLVTVAGGPTNCMRPFGVETAVLGNPQIAVGSVFAVGDGAPGNWGKINIAGVNMSSGTNFVNHMQHGMCDPNITVDGALPVGTGYGGSLSTGFDGVVNQTFHIARTSNFPNGSGQITVLEFMTVSYLGDNGRNGSNWLGYFRLLGRNSIPPVGGGGGAVSNPRLVR